MFIVLSPANHFGSCTGRVGEYQKSGVMNSLKKGGESDFVFKTEEDF